MRIGWIGFHAEGVLALEAAVRAGYDVVGVISLRPERAALRSAAVDYAAVCRRLGVPVHFVKNINDPDSVEHLHGMHLDLGIVLGWSQILRSEALRSARLGMVGAHASLLPHNRGSAPVNWAIIRGEATTGNSLMWLSEGVDEGHLIDQRSFPITPYDTCATVYEKVAASNREMVLALLEQLRLGQRPGRPQPETDEPLLPRRRPADGTIDWSRSAGEVYDFIRALTRPYPGACGWLGGEKLKIWQAAVLPTPARGMFAAGTVIGAARSPEPRACGQVVACGDGSLLVLEVERDDDNAVLRGSALAELNWQGLVWQPPRVEEKQKVQGHAA